MPCPDRAQGGLKLPFYPCGLLYPLWPLLCPLGRMDWAAQQLPALVRQLQPQQKRSVQYQLQQK